MKRLVVLIGCCVLAGAMGDRLLLRIGGEPTSRESAVSMMPASYADTAPTAHPAQSDNPIKMSALSLSAQADLSQVTFTYHIRPSGRSANVGIQIFVNKTDATHKEDPKSSQKWVEVDPKDAAGGPLILNLYDGIDNTGEFSITMDRGTYGAVRVLLFDAPDGKTLDFNKTLYDSDREPNAHLDLNLVVKTSGRRVTAPKLEMDEEPKVSDDGSGAYTVTFKGSVKMPQGYKADQSGFWVMAKGDAGFGQVWIKTDEAQVVSDPYDAYLKMPVEITIKNVKPGLWNSQFGLFKYSFGDPLQWIATGVDFETSSDWVHKAPAESLPPRLQVREHRFETLDGRPYDFYSRDPSGMRAVSFVRGGNYGNAIDWTLSPEYNRPGYFVLLKGMGCRFMRVIFQPERYLRQAVYRNAVDQIVQNIWAAELYPVLGPQGLVKADTVSQQEQLSIKVVEAMATRYRGKPIWLEICNEPFEVTGWEQWKPMAVAMTQAIRRIDPDAFVVVPFEGWSKDGRSAAKDPIKETRVDLYDAHAYIDPSQVTTNYLPAIEAGLPVYIGEYGSTDAAYLGRMDSELQRLPGLLAAGPWAFTKAGQDSLPLIADGSTAELRFTSAGQQIADDYTLWNQGRRKTP